MADVIFCHFAPRQKLTTADVIFGRIKRFFDHWFSQQFLLLFSSLASRKHSQQHDVRTSSGLTAWIFYVIGHESGTSLEKLLWTVVAQLLNQYASLWINRLVKPFVVGGVGGL